MVLESQLPHKTVNFLRCGVEASDASEFGFRGWEVARNLCGATSPLRVIAHVHAVPGSGFMFQGCRSGFVFQAVPG